MKVEIKSLFKFHPSINQVLMISLVAIYTYTDVHRLKWIKEICMYMKL